MKYVLSLLFLLAVTLSSANNKLKTVCTTTDLSSIVLAIGKDEVTVNTIIPYGMCPGHTDISPREISQVKNADLVLANGFESFLSDITASDELKIIKIETKKNLMVPANHIWAAKELTNILIDKKPDLKIYFMKNCYDYINEIKKIEKEILEKLNEIRGKDVVCAFMNKEFVEWLGANVIAVFPRDEDLSLKSLNDIVSNARRNNPALVIDNLQSSGKVGETIAKELDLPLVILSNFPEEDDYLSTLKNNCSKIMTTFHEYSYELHH
jgi:zinc transport system substrate-binding protein